MKILNRLSWLFVCSLCISVYAQESSSNTAKEVKGPQLVFSDRTYDFGEIVQGKKVSYVFDFENTGNEPLLLVNIATTCGCTAPSWPRQPILPGEKGEVKVVFKTEGKSGAQSKAVTVYSNANDSPHVLTLVGTIRLKNP